jgi:hypothetical protein
MAGWLEVSGDTADGLNSGVVFDGAAQAVAAQESLQ